MADVDVGAGSVVVQLFSSDAGRRVPHYQVFEDGRLIDWKLGLAPDRRFAIFPAEDTPASGFLPGASFGNAALTTSSIAERRNGTWVHFRPPPLDEGLAPAFDSLPRVPSADVVIQVLLTNSPFGDVSYRMQFDDGRRSLWSLGEGDSADVLVECPFALYARLRAGEIGLGDMLERCLVEGRIMGELWTLMLAVGVAEGPEYRAIRRHACLRDCLVPLASYAEIVTHPDFRQAALQAETVLTS